MRTIEYRTQDKSEWGPGPWQDEPDKVQWLDPVTNYPCLIVRSQVSGSLCGYVGVPKEHPAYGLDYDGTTAENAKARRTAQREAIRKKYSGLGQTVQYVNDGLPDFSEVPEEVVVPVVGDSIRNMEVHGGLTFAGPCRKATVEEWETIPGRIKASEKEAARFPKGNAARFIAEMSPIKTYEQFAAKCEAQSICHKPDDGEPDDVWWFGFDTAHAWDLAPGLKAALRAVGGTTGYTIRDEAYRDKAYVTAQVESLAKQLLKLEEDHA